MNFLSLIGCVVTFFSFGSNQQQKTPQDIAWQQIIKKADVVEAKKRLHVHPEEASQYLKQVQEARREAEFVAEHTMTTWEKCQSGFGAAVIIGGIIALSFGVGDYFNPADLLPRLNNGSETNIIAGIEFLGGLCGAGAGSYVAYDAVTKGPSKREFKDFAEMELKMREIQEKKNN